MKRVTDKWGFNGMELGDELFYDWLDKQTIRAAKWYWERVTDKRYLTFKAESDGRFYIGINRIK